MRSIGIFGSFATGDWDEWSDLDLFVACDEPGRVAPLILGEVDARIPILCYRPFSAAGSSDGRYWFRDQSPFHKLDVSFHGDGDWHRVTREHREQGDLMLCPRGRGPYRRCEAPAFSWEYTLHQEALFDIVHRVHRYSRAYARTGSDSEHLSREVAKMKQHVAENSPENRYDERAWELAARMAGIAEKLLNDDAQRTGHGQ